VIELILLRGKLNGLRQEIREDFFGRLKLLVIEIRGAFS
jgi:hypothetical protein